jgi:hypothetical protein
MRSNDSATTTPPRVEVVDGESATIWASKTGAERLAIAAGMFRSARRMMESHLRAEHPPWSPEQIDAEIRRRFGHGTG